MINTSSGSSGESGGGGSIAEVKSCENHQSSYGCDLVNLVNISLIYLEADEFLLRLKDPVDLLFSFDTHRRKNICRQLQKYLQIIVQQKILLMILFLVRLL